MNEISPDFKEEFQDYQKMIISMFEDNYRRIFNYILYSTGDVETALDITSETFLKAMKGLSSFEYHGRKSFVAWLYKIASREIAMYFRRLSKDKKYLTFESSVAEEIREAVSPQDIESASRELDRCEDFIIIVPFFKELPAKYREVLFLKFFEDMTFIEIADLLRRPIGTVKAQCHRGLRILRKRMQPIGTTEHLNNKKRNEILEIDSIAEEAKDIGT